MDLGMDDDEPPTVWDAVNYPTEDQFSFDSFYIRYERQAEAKAIIDKPVNDTWQDAPIIHDAAHEDEEEPKSTFETQIETFFAGDYTRRKPLHRLNVLDRLGRLGEYSLLVLGVADESADLEEPLQDDELDGLDDLHYLATFGQDRIVDMDIESDMTSERFRLPVTFEVVTEEADESEENHSQEEETEEIHWTRVIHVPEGSLEDDLRGTPALKPVFHELLNIDKIKAASGEGFWRGGYQGMVVSPPTDANGEPMQFEDGGEGVEQEIQEFLNNFQRTIATPANIQELEGGISNPGPHLDANYQSIAAALDLPKSILTGEEQANTASSEDVRQWHQKVGQRRNNFAGPVILEPLIQRMVDKGLLPAPDGEGFIVEWPPLDELSEQEEAELKSTKANTIRNLAPGGDPSTLGTVAELRRVLDWGPVVGSEVDDAADVTDEQLEVDESTMPEPDDENESGDETNDADGGGDEQ